MILAFHTRIKKQYKKLSSDDREKFNERMALFEKYPFNQVFRNHALKGKYLGYRSIDITGNLRAIYQPLGSNTAYFVYLGTHSNLYK
ncbi:hypothetical protein COW81_00370 [Candidatus Campbellbacteria bacterium CG22_combo_CG10-13_8_21_14_all_36_13]|uniref:Type II toxin-antitoxin system mRNA interferase toxin, RelE/StbE family n=1 Tax=Candidatus Campbellbacteria bacterium CG22_combo_CG10-13_8_21_14_all_36_13 TaxID=1974529 RepID=A0A2H0DZS6_9BACT|nr:MAG: hypothetical protein COW81_00370 [Candidatus Campbellbacteria bacterium CG22_combo_CG10-13_8_21_14_all_36_13]